MTTEISLNPGVELMNTVKPQKRDRKYKKEPTRAEEYNKSDKKYTRENPQIRICNRIDKVVEITHSE